MARITYVKAAQQRYETVPVIDPETGQQKQTPVMRNGKQRTTKTGRPIFLSITQPDKSKPLPNRHCGKCQAEIKVGDPYKHISPKSGPYGGRTLYRCGTCPNWNVWEYSSSLSARLAEISFNFSTAVDTADSEEDVQTALSEAAEAVREIASEKEEGADNIEQGFQHETQQSQELRDIADQLNSWADDIEGATIPDFPDPADADCEECDGTGTVPNEDHAEIESKLTQAKRRLAMMTGVPVEVQLHSKIALEQALIEKLTKDLEETEEMLSCDTCDGTGHSTSDEPTADQMEAWREEVAGDLSIVDESPV